MIISLDYDNCFTLDPVFWIAFIQQAAQHNHRVLICSFRPETHAIPMSGFEIHYTAGKAKKPFLAAKGIHPQIFIDDKCTAHLFDENQAT